MSMLIEINRSPNGEPGELVEARAYISQLQHGWRRRKGRRRRSRTSSPRHAWSSASVRMATTPWPARASPTAGYPRGVAPMGCRRSWMRSTRTTGGHSHE